MARTACGMRDGPGPAVLGWRRGRFAALALLAVCAAGPALADSRVALVIGNGAYAAVPPLPNPAGDAAAVAAKLRRLGFAVTEGTDLGKAAMDRMVREFGAQAERADVAMVFYAGHGIQVGSRNYLVPADAKAPVREEDLRYDFVNVDAVMAALSGARVLRIVVLDACRDNPLAVSLGPAGRRLGAGRGLAAPAAADNTLIAYATAADATAADGGSDHSPFTQALLDHLDDPGLDIRLMFGRVRDEVRRATGNGQNPFVYASMGGDNFTFNPGPADAAAAPIAAAADEAPVKRPDAPPARGSAQTQPFDAGAPPLPSQPEPAPGWAALLPGRWRLAGGQACERGGYGIITAVPGALRFEWHLPGGGVNVAVERIDAAGSTVQTTVVSDVGTPTPEVGQRVRYAFRPDGWTSVNLTTGERGWHVRC